MKLVRLTLSGFKSFAVPVELPFDEGVTAIVGPNGCGKSNISDAVRWVLGEHNPRVLRGARMEEVIFQGSTGRRPQNIAEVSLLFDNADRALDSMARLLTADVTILAAVGFAAFLGHLYPVFFGFKGGKGVATALGVLFGLAWPVALATLATWLAMAALFRYSSLSALTAAVAAPIYMWRLDGTREFILMGVVLSVLLIWRHRFITDTWGWEVPAGWIDPGETAAEAAIREAEEETGFRVGELRELASYYAMPGLTDHRFTVFAADGAEDLGHDLDPTETAKVEWVSLGDYGRLLHEGTLTDGPSITSLGLALALAAPNG